MSRTDPEDNLTPVEIESLNQLEATARDGLGTYVQVGNALAEIRDQHLYRDSHPSFEAYVSERWGIDIPTDHPSSKTAIPADTGVTPTAGRPLPATIHNKPCEALAEACEQTLSALADDDRIAIEIRLAVRKQGNPGAFTDAPSLELTEALETVDDELLPTLRWLLTQASGTIGEVAYELERRAADIDEDARAQLRDDVLVLDDELATVKALLIGLIDWDSELARLLKGEFPPLDTDRDPGDDE
jgi:hypothetical protein